MQTMSKTALPKTPSSVRRQAAGIAAKAPRCSRRRLIDPTTCERDYSSEELEFMQAIEQYKYRSGRMFPTQSEVLEVVRSLGYVRGGTA
ncbi:MAG: hypothetical protein WCI78_17145 [Mycobacterium sp.]